MIKRIFYRLGFGTPVPVSAEHGQGLADLYDAIAAKINTKIYKNFNPHF